MPSSQPELVGACIMLGMINALENNSGLTFLRPVSLEPEKCFIKIIDVGSEPSWSFHSFFSEKTPFFAEQFRRFGRKERSEWMPFHKGNAWSAQCTCSIFALHSQTWCMDQSRGLNLLYCFYSLPNDFFQMTLDPTVKLTDFPRSVFRQQLLDFHPNPSETRAHSNSQNGMKLISGEKCIGN